MHRTGFKSLQIVFYNLSIKSQCNENEVKYDSGLIYSQYIVMDFIREVHWRLLPSLFLFLPFFPFPSLYHLSHHFSYSKRGLRGQSPAPHSLYLATGTFIFYKCRIWNSMNYTCAFISFFIMRKGASCCSGA